MADHRLDQELERALEERARFGLQRETSLDGVVPGVDFGSNDYLGLSGDEGLAAALTAAAAHGVGGRSARLLAGGSPLHEAAELIAEQLGIPGLGGGQPSHASTYLPQVPEEQEEEAESDESPVSVKSRRQKRKTPQIRMCEEDVDHNCYRFASPAEAGLETRP